MFILRLALAVCVLAPLPAVAQSNDPAATVAALIKLDTKGDWTPVFANEPTPTMRRFFTPAFNVAWRKAMKHNTDYPVFDADPLTGAQASGAPILKSISADLQGVVTAIIASREMPALQVSVRFVMVREGSGWRIDDIEYPDNRPALRAALGMSR
ncbi:MAG: hypothetical protein ACKVON_12640 [Beijerinckiaceae bacterium]